MSDRTSENSFVCTTSFLQTDDLVFLVQNAVNIKKKKRPPRRIHSMEFYYYYFNHAKKLKVVFESNSPGFRTNRPAHCSRLFTFCSLVFIATLKAASWKVFYLFKKHFGLTKLNVMQCWIIRTSMASA